MAICLIVRLDSRSAQCFRWTNSGRCTIYVQYLYNICTIVNVQILYKYCTYIVKYDENSVQKVDACKNFFVHLHRQCRFAQTLNFCVMY